MIKKTEPLSMAESLEYMKENNEVKAFVKKFISMKPEKAKELRTKLNELGLLKLNSMQVSKLIDNLPEDKETLNKILIDVNLDENETNTILQTIKEFK